MRHPGPARAADPIDGAGHRSVAPDRSAPRDPQRRIGDSAEALHRNECLRRVRRVGEGPRRSCGDDVASTTCEGSTSRIGDDVPSDDAVDDPGYSLPVAMCLTTSSIPSPVSSTSSR